MIKKIFALSFFSALSALSASAQDVLISEFGTSPVTQIAPFSTRASSAWSNTLIVNQPTFTSFTDPSYLTGGGMTTTTFSPVLNVGANDRLRVTARTETGNLATNFIVTLYSNSTSVVTDFASASFTVSSFTGSFTSVTSSAWAITGTFNPANVVRFGISGGTPFGADRFAMSFDTLTATSAAPIPEPSTYASLAGVAVLGFVAYRRRKNVVVGA
jgi:hypothetical protein